MSRKCSYTWKINDFKYLDTPTGHSIKSPVFWIDNEFKWKLELYPRGKNRASSDYLSVFIKLASVPEYPIVSAKCEFAILDGDDHIIHEVGFEKNNHLEDLNNGYGYSKFMPRKTLFHKKYLVRRGTLKLFCKVTYYSSNMLNTICLYQNNEYSKMLMNTAFSDITFQVGNEKFPAHKVILAAKSPKFYQALQLERSGNIMIVDVTPEIFAEMLRFMYTGTVKHLHTYAKDLIVAAEDYQIYDLRDTCVNYLVGILTVDNAIDMVQFAKDCNCHALEDKVMKFINEKFVNETSKYLVSQLTHVLKYSRLN